MSKSKLSAETSSSTLKTRITARLRQTPWWALSLAFHALALFLVSLITLTINSDRESEYIVVTQLESGPLEIRRDDSKPEQVDALRSHHDTPPTDPTSQTASEIIVPPDILSKAELGDHFESINPDRADARSAFGNAEAEVFHMMRSSDLAGGGVGGLLPDNLIGVGGAPSGFGGGHGSGVGVSSGSGKGSFGHRNGGGRRLMVKRLGGSRSTECSAPRSPADNLRLETVTRALNWLAQNQSADGSWDCGGNKGKEHDTAVTGMALLAFLRAGETPAAGRHRAAVSRAIDWLRAQQRADGLIADAGEKPAYSHAIAALSLTEAAGLSKDPDVRSAAERALNWSCASADATANAWRYEGPGRDGDLSVTGWFLLQLSSARRAGMNVPEASFQKAENFLKSVTSRDADGVTLYHYKPNGPTNPRMNAVGNLCRQLLGADAAKMDGDIEQLFAQSSAPDPKKPDLYHWYYGSLCGAQHGGEGWNRWQSSLTRSLSLTQNRAGKLAGSWDPAGPYSDHWGRVGQTALGALCLEVSRQQQPATAPDAPKDAAAPELAAEEIVTKTPAELEAETLENESYARLAELGFKRVQGDDALSTFSIDVDTAAYSNVRRILNSAQRPPKGAVRIEELVNYFPYSYPAPKKGDAFAVHCEVAECPWNAEHRLALVGLKGREIPWDERPASNLVFLVDVSGSMSGENRLPLVKTTLKMLVDRLGRNDRVALVTYAGQSGVVLGSTSCDQAATIKKAIEQMGAGGSTNGAAGIQEAYRVAAENFIQNGTNRVILCTDGDFNVGVSDRGELQGMIEQKAKTGVFLSVMGFGMGNYKDATLELLADKGNGNYGYIDTEKEARKLLVDQIGGTLITIAKDVKIQVEFNPQVAGAYRLIGYENRVMAAKDFRDDKKDAGEIGAGHTVTALYEIVPPLSKIEGQAGVEKRKYLDDDTSGELFTVFLRHKLPDSDRATEMNIPVTDKNGSWKLASESFRWAATVAMFGMQLRNSEHKGTCDWPMVKKTARDAMGADAGGYRAEFLELIDKAAELTKQPMPRDEQF